jgi:branched-chain amino acid transport system substrate-binding protein
MRANTGFDRGAEQLLWPQILHAMNRLCGASGRRLAATLACAAMAGPLLAERAHAAGQGDEIRIGNTMPYSGPAAAYGLIGKIISAYFDKVNAEGGINGRKVRFISYDDGYNPAKTLELTKKLVEEDQVLLTFAGLGTDTMAAIQPYMNASKVPQLFIASGATMWDKPREFPWTTGFQPSYQTEAHIYAEYLLENHPRGKIAILYQDDAFGKDYLKGLKDGLGGKIPVVAEVPYKVSDTSIDAQIAKLRASGADIFLDITTPKFAAMAIKRTAEIGWKPVHIISSVARSLQAVLPPAGLPMAEGVLSTAYTVEGDDPAVASDPAYGEYNAFLERYVPSPARSNALTIYGYVTARAMVEVLKRSGDDLSRENVMRQAASLKGLQVPMLLPGITINTSPSDHAPLEQMQITRFTGGRWEPVGPVRSGIDPGSVSESFKTIFRYGTAKRDLATQLNANTVSIVSGSYGSTYAQMGADLASVLDKDASLRVMPVMGRGSVQAVADILLLKGIDAGIVRKDTLAFLERKDFANEIRNQFVYVAKLFNEEMHVLAPRSIASMKDLDGKTVVVDLPDSSTFVTAINVFERLSIRPHLLYVEPRLALDMLRKGEVDAIVTIEGKPLTWLSQVADRNLHLVPVDYAKPLQEEYLPAKISASDYPNLVPEGGYIDTIAAEAVLASYNWAPNSDRYRRLSLLVDSLFSGIGQLQRPPFHPKWKELAPRAPVAGWTRFKGAQEWLDRHIPPTAAVAAASGAAPRPETGPRDEALYREFLEWRAKRAKASMPSAPSAPSASSALKRAGKEARNRTSR